MVDIWATKIDYNYDNPIQVIAPLISIGNTGTEKPARVVDLKRRTESLNVAGYLTDEEGLSAKTKRNNLMTLALSVGLNQNQRELTVVWGQTAATDEQTVWSPTTTGRGVFIQKIMFSETVGIVGEKVSDSDVNPPERNIAINIQLVRGKDM